MSGGLRHQLGDQLDLEQVTVGTTTQSGTNYYGYSSGSYGSISDGAFVPKGGAAIATFVWASSGILNISVTGVFTNDGWTQVVIGGVTFKRADATFTTGANTVWYWTGAANPFGTTVGAVVTAIFS